MLLKPSAPFRRNRGIFIGRDFSRNQFHQSKYIVMFSGKFFLTVIVIAVAVTFIQWFFTGFLFHRYQSVTPSTWRKESNRSYAASMLLSLFFAFMFTVVFYFWKSKSGDIYLIDGIKFGLVC